MKWLDEEKAKLQKELEERMTPLRLRDKRAAVDDGYEDYLTEAEAMTRSVLVAASREKISLLEEFGDIIKEGNDDRNRADAGREEGNSLHGTGEDAYREGIRHKKDKHGKTIWKQAADVRTKDVRGRHTC